MQEMFCLDALNYGFFPAIILFKHIVIGKWFK